MLIEMAIQFANTEHKMRLIKYENNRRLGTLHAG
jgi:hypothetical protein